MSFDTRFDTVLASVQLYGYTLIVTTICGMPGRFRALVTAPDGSDVADISWPGSPLDAAEEARHEALLHAGEELYEVSLWCSLPGTNDDCSTGARFETFEAALACYRNPWRTFCRSFDSSTAYFALTRVYKGEIDPANRPNVLVTYTDEIDVSPNPGYDAERVERERRRDEVMARQERAMQAGMAFGCDGYNDEMGW